MSRIRASLSANDVFALVGLGALAVGVGLISVPAAFIVVGAALLLYAILPDRQPGAPA